MFICGIMGGAKVAEDVGDMLDTDIETAEDSQRENIRSDFSVRTVIVDSSRGWGTFMRTVSGKGREEEET